MPNARGVPIGPNQNRRQDMITRFRDMLDKGLIGAIERMDWSADCLPEFYVEARKKSYWLNIVKLNDPVKLKGGSRIKLIKFGELTYSADHDIDADIYDDLLNLLSERYDYSKVKNWRGLK